MGWRVRDAREALAATVARGATHVADVDLAREGHPLPAISGIGGSLIYFVDGYAAPAAARV